MDQAMVSNTRRESRNYAAEELIAGLGAPLSVRSLALTAISGIGHWIELLKIDKRVSPPAAVLQRQQITYAGWRLQRRSKLRREATLCCAAIISQFKRQVPTRWGSEHGGHP
jgi:hypothetical protein